MLKALSKQSYAPCRTTYYLMFTTKQVPCARKLHGSEVAKRCFMYISFSPLLENQSIYIITFSTQYTVGCKLNAPLSNPLLLLLLSQKNIYIHTQDMLYQAADADSSLEFGGYSIGCCIRPGHRCLLYWKLKWWISLLWIVMNTGCGEGMVEHFTVYLLPFFPP